MRFIAGDEKLFTPLRQSIFDKVANSESLQARIAQEAVATPPPLNFLGKLIVEKKGRHEGLFDIKSRGLSLLRDATRLLALKEGITNRYSTGGRLEELQRKDEYKEIATLALESYDLMLRLRTYTGIKQNNSGRYINPAELSKMKRSRLANSFDVVRLIQQSLSLKYQLDTRPR